MIKRKVLSNGMTVIFKERKNGVVSVAFAVRYGGANEGASEKGIAHFIEHMLYKGTSKRNNLQIASEIEKNGGELNGFTSEQVTAYWCRMPSKHIRIALDVLSDLVKNPLFEKTEVEKERQVIFEEMKMYQDNPRMHVFEKIKSNLYQGNFSMPIIGTKKSMEANNREKLVKKFGEIYSSSNMILAVAGDADFKKLCDYAENNFVKKFSKIKSPQIVKINKSSIEKRKGIDQANLIFAFHIPKTSDKRYHAAEVLMTLIAGGMSSRLFSEIREKRNLAYAVKGFTEGEKDYAYAGIYVGTTPKNVEIVKKLILEEFDKVSKDLDVKELEQTKEQIIGNYIIGQEDSQKVLIDLLMSEIKGNAQEADKYFENIRNVKLGDVKEMAKIKNWSFFALVPK